MLSRVWLVAEATTNRRHIEFAHKPDYVKWCTSNNFTSKLPKDVAAQKKAREAEEKEKLKQATLEFQSKERPARIVKFTDARFREAAQDWLIATNQVRLSL
jgi:hypothetical protein